MSKFEGQSPNQLNMEAHMTEQKKLKRNQVLMPNSSIYTIKTDKFQKERLKLGGETKMLDISCAHCHTQLMVYQKDGLGPLKRCYLDRIGWLQEGIGQGELPNQVSALEKSMLCCPGCQENIGYPMVYDKENRLAIRMFPGQFAKTKYQAPESK